MAMTASAGRRQGLRAFALAATIAAAPAAPAAGAEARLLLATPDIRPATVSAVAAQGRRFALLGDGAGQWRRVGIGADGGLSFMPAAPPAKPATRPDMLPDGEIALGGRNIRAAWLTGPTGRYAHGVLGDAIEASGIAVETRAGDVAAFELPEDSVFEDRYPRLADVDGDGEDEIAVVRSYLERGAALSILKIVGGKLRIAWETPPIGQPNRWLNPVGIGDLDGDGRPDAAFVATPHIGGALSVFTVRDGRLTRTQAHGGFSNHAIGTRALGLSGLADVDGDGILDALVPDAGRRTMLAVGFAQGRYREIARVALPAAVASDIALVDLDGNGVADPVFALADGRIAAILFGR